ncbi:hypothetical protein [Bacteroides clarus]|uniref:hypothetical protein n=1 Tax=Bacteroides clarus TaxID=626929 RepID=UPI00242D7BA5|nr:hypothetical protein [Bacteroides clarus]
MSNENSNLRVGSAGAGLLVGDKLIAGKEFDWSKLYANLSYVWPDGGRTSSFPVIVANLSSDPVLLQRDGETEEVAPGKIDWYTIGGQGQSISEISLFNEDANGNGASKRVVQFYSTMYAEGESINYGYAHNVIVDKNELINDFTSEVYKQFAWIVFIFDN